MVLYSSVDHYKSQCQVVMKCVSKINCPTVCQFLCGIVTMVLKTGSMQRIL